MRISIIITILLFLTSCVETIVVGSIATTTILTREKTISTAKDDVAIAARVLKSFSGKKLEKKGDFINITVDESRVLLTGMVSKISTAKKAAKLAWEAKGVKEVINEIEVVKKGSIIGNLVRSTKDGVVTSNVESRILLTKNISSKNAKITTVNGSVYLLGVAKSDYEINRITHAVSKAKGVKRVVSHLILVDDSRRKG